MEGIYYVQRCDLFNGKWVDEHEKPYLTRGAAMDHYDRNVKYRDHIAWRVVRIDPIATYVPDSKKYEWPPK